MGRGFSYANGHVHRGDAVISNHGGWWSHGLDFRGYRCAVVDAGLRPGDGEYCVEFHHPEQFKNA